MSPARYHQDQYKKVLRHVEDTIIHSVKKIRSHKPDIAVGSSGTIMNLAEIAQKALSPEWEFREQCANLQRFTESH